MGTSIMKFTYEKQDRSDDDVVAYIDKDGDLVIKSHDGNGVCIFISGGVLDYGYVWRPRYAVHKFYPGDKITLEF